MTNYFRYTTGAALSVVLASAALIGSLKASGCSCLCNEPDPEPDSRVEYYWENNPPNRYRQDAAVQKLAYDDISLHLQEPEFL
ncbi:hypothetical protein KY362_05025 [Candidatus Woesearchaeota archaeon]|nr:hypothetical protein [Candidatus Woesearchaeota archaeon]